MALKCTAGVIGKSSMWVHTVHGSMDRSFQALTLYSVFTVWPIESRIAGAGVAVYSLNALPVLAASRIAAGGCVAQGPLSFEAGLVIPLARGRFTLNVDLHAVLVVPLVVGLIVSPVLSLLRESLVGSHPRPLIIDLSDPYPVVRAEVRDDVIEVFDFCPILDGH